MKLLKYIFLILMVVGQSTSFAIQGNSKALLALVETHISRGEPKKALKMLSDGIDVTPNDIELLTKRAEVYRILLKKKEAKKDFLKVLDINSRYGPALFGYAEYQVHIEQLDSALWYIDKALTYEHSSSVMESLYLLKGNIFMSLKDYKVAEDNLFLAVNRSEVSITTMRDLATVLSENRNDHAALYVIEETMMIFGEHLEQLINAGYVCNRLSRFDEAIVHLKKALIQDPHQPIAHSNLAEAYLHQGSATLAFEHIEKSLQNDRLNPYAYKVKGDILRMMNEPKKACKSYKRAYALDYNSKYDRVSLIKTINNICGKDGIISE